MSRSTGSFARREQRAWPRSLEATRERLGLLMAGEVEQADEVAATAEPDEEVVVT